MAEDTKDTEKAPKDTMHAGPQAAPAGVDLTSSAATAALKEAGIQKDPPPPNTQGEQSTVSVGEFDPEPGSTLVTDIPAAEEPEEAAPLNAGSEGVPGAAKQPTESSEDAGKRISAASKESDKAAAKK